MRSISKILVFGNPLVRNDSLPLSILPALRKEFPSIDFRELDGIDDIQNEGRSLVILDSAEGIEEPVIIKDARLIESGKKYSVHDFDLGQNIRLLCRIGSIEDVTIICIPRIMDRKDALEKTSRLIRSILHAGNGKHSSCRGHMPG